MAELVRAMAVGLTRSASWSKMKKVVGLIAGNYKEVRVHTLSCFGALLTKKRVDASDWTYKYVFNDCSFIY